MSAIVAIPARLESSRFPNKILADIHGMPMLWHVYQGASQAQLVSQVCVLTDSTKVFDLVSSWGARALMTLRSCTSGTDRIASVAEQLDADIIVNVQGDQPLITGEIIDSLVAALLASNADVATPVYRIRNVGDLTNPNAGKVVRGSDNQALYFSRNAIPYVRDLEMKDWLTVTPFWGTVGMYAYWRRVLLEYHLLPEAQTEAAEKLEQLRLLEAGKRILTVEIENRLEDVDIPADLDLVKEIMASRGKSPVA